MALKRETNRQTNQRDVAEKCRRNLKLGRNLTLLCSEMIGTVNESK